MCFTVKKSFLLGCKDYLFHIFTCPHTKELAKTILLTLSLQEHLQGQPDYSKASTGHGDGELTRAASTIAFSNSR